MIVGFLASRWIFLWVGGDLLVWGWWRFVVLFFLFCSQWRVLVVECQFFCFVFAIPCSGVCWHSCLCSHLANLTGVLCSVGWISCRASSWSYATSFYVGPHFSSGYYAPTVYRQVIVLSVNCSLMESVTWWFIKPLQIFFFLLVPWIHDWFCGWRVMSPLKIHLRF